MVVTIIGHYRQAAVIQAVVNTGWTLVLTLQAHHAFTRNGCYTSNCVQLHELGIC